MKTQDEVVATVNKVIQDLTENQILQRLPGNCVLAADLVQNMLYSEGINSKPVEVQVIFTKLTDQGEKFTHLLGYDNKFHTPYEHDTHVVVITETDPPYLVDTSIGNIVGNLEAVVIQPISLVSNSDIVCQAQTNECDVVYRIKKNIKLPFFHQRDMIEKLKDHVKLTRNLQLLRKLVIITVSLGIINFAINMTIISMKLAFGS